MNFSYFLFDMLTLSVKLFKIFTNFKMTNDSGNNIWFEHVGVVEKKLDFISNDSKQLHEVY